MKIGIVCYPTFGGSGVVATELGKALAAEGNKVHFITYSQPVRLDGFAENIFYHEVNVSDYPLFDYSPYEIVLASKIVDVAMYEKLDVLHVHYAIPHASAAHLAQQILKTKGIDLPFITTLHGTDITLVGKDASFEPVITFSINNSNVVTAVSEDLKKETLAHFGVTKEIEVVPNFVCLDNYKEAYRPELRKAYAPNGEKILIHVSNFRKVKRVDDVLEIFKKVVAKTPAKLLMVGDGPERHEIEKMCREQDSCGDVLFLGKLRSTTEVLSVSDLFLLTSATESFGLAALEAMACHVPVVSSNTGGIPEVNIHGVSGYLSNVGDTDEMAENALKILTDENELSRFKANAYKTAQKYDIKKVLPLYHQIYQRLIENSNS